jgi:hypothetical protein
MALDDDVLNHPELYPCYIVYLYLTLVRPHINDFLKLQIIDQHLQLRHNNDEHCILIDLRNDMFDFKKVLDSNGPYFLDNTDILSPPAKSSILNRETLFFMAYLSGNEINSPL